MSRYFAVQVSFEDARGTTVSRTYVRPEHSRLSEDAWASFALGDVLRLTGTHTASKITVTEQAGRPCYHPRSCPACQRFGYACGQHTTASRYHDRCSGNGPTIPGTISKEA